MIDYNTDMTKGENVSLNELQALIRQFVDARDWSQFHNPKDLAISLSLEAGEVMEHFQWKNNEEVATHIKQMKAEVGEELADVLYWVLLLANNLEVDLVDAFQKKLHQNEVKYPVARKDSRETRSQRGCVWRQ